MLLAQKAIGFFSLGTRNCINCHMILFL